MAAWSGYTPPSTVAAPASLPSGATVSVAGWASYNPASAVVSSGSATSTTTVSTVDAAWQPYPGTGSNGGGGGNQPLPLTQAQINLLVANAAPLLLALRSDTAAMQQAWTNYLATLPTSPQPIPGWWNNGGSPVLS